MEMPGGGGIGRVAGRERTEVLADVRAGYVSTDAARAGYNVDPDDAD